MISICYVSGDTLAYKEVDFWPSYLAYGILESIKIAHIKDCPEEEAYVGVAADDVIIWREKYSNGTFKTCPLF